MILLQGRQEGQMGCLVSVLAPSSQRSLGDCKGSDRQGPLPPGLLPGEARCPQQPRLLGLDRKIVV